MRIALPGATGLIGSRLTELLLDSGHEPVVLSRCPDKLADRFKSLPAFKWDPLQEALTTEPFDAVDAVVNMAAVPIDVGRWNDARKTMIRDSRVLGTRRIVQALSKLDRKPEVLVAGSAVGYYGSRGDEVLHEDSAPGDDFLGTICRQVEAEADRAKDLGVRVVNLRTGHRPFPWRRRTIEDVNPLQAGPRRPPRTRYAVVSLDPPDRPCRDHSTRS